MSNINRYLCSHPTMLRDIDATSTFLKLLQSFNCENIAIATSHNFSTNAPDRLDRVVSLAFDVYETLRKRANNGGAQRIVLGGAPDVLSALHHTLLTS